MQARRWHRWVGSALGLLLLYLGLTGSVVQGIDLHALLTHAPETDPEMMAIRESMDGPGNYAVIAASDYTAAALPPASDPAAMAQRVFAAAHASAPGNAIRWVDLRMQGGKAVGQAGMGEDALWRFDPASGRRLPDPPVMREKGPPFSWHLYAKRWHRLWSLGDGMLWLNALAGLGLGFAVIAGLLLWWQLYRARWRMGRRAPAWKGGGAARVAHRALGPVMAVPLLVVAVSGTILSIDSLALQIYRLRYPDRLAFGVVPQGMIADQSRPLTAGEVSTIARTTLTLHQAESGGAPIRALRIRIFAGMPQGVIITGEPLARQLVYDTAQGRRAGMSEPTYPDTVFPTGWDWHERLKRIHRGDEFGMIGRWLGLMAGLSLMWFAGSGLWMYRELYLRRRKGGRQALFWR
ncbi:PepSY-associated TM helix domain-containing protein [Novosphingobium terrae]|uniref:PepSY-associated TM helix domain-containing protein n=1 Tax=Novosphingobium terrae TaxID=2726189 RepID=UPI00197E9FB8|nr:PepSY-associated TM helix domain-containing protein [Novosphingobium terrae]